MIIKHGGHGCLRNWRGVQLILRWSVAKITGKMSPTPCLPVLILPYFRLLFPLHFQQRTHHSWRPRFPQLAVVTTCSHTCLQQQAIHHVWKQTKLLDSVWTVRREYIPVTLTFHARQSLLPWWQVFGQRWQWWTVCRNRRKKVGGYEYHAMVSSAHPLGAEGSLWFPEKFAISSRGIRD